MSKEKVKVCHHCDGKGFVAIRDCVGKVQYESTCQMCGGTGTQDPVEDCV